MARYFSRPKSWVADETYGDEPVVPGIVVADHEAANTGLLDVNGYSIWRAPNPMGFGRDDEW